MIGKTVSHYQILEELGAGGMGIVYKAKDLKLGRIVALKFLPTEITRDSKARERFIREARAASSLDHPNVCTVYEIDETDDHRVFFAMALCEGETLHSIISRGPVPMDRALRITIGVASALAKAHHAGVVHRDIKPSNVMVSGEGEVKVLDFGLAKFAGDRTLTRAGTILGSPPYMSPEQITGKPTDHRTDIWSLGVVFYEMLTGDLPFRGANDRAIFDAILHQEPSELSIGGEPIVTRVWAGIRRALRKDPAERFDKIDEWLREMRELEQELRRYDSIPTAQRTSEARREAASIAVLPFADMSSTRDQDYFCEGVAEEIINSLTHVEGLRVASRTSSFQFKGAAEDIRRIGDRLNVRSVLEGSVRKAGDRVRVTVQLINVSDGYHLWSERYDRKLEDIFAIQDEIAESTARALEVALSEEPAPPRRAQKTDLEAYEFYLRGRQLMSELRQRSIRRAREMFMRSVEIDPEYALAHTGIADASAWMVMWLAGTEADLRQAEHASARALELAPDLAESQVSRGMILSLARRYDEAERHFLRAIELNPRSFEAHYYYGRSLFSNGRLEEAAVMMGKAAELRPEDYQTAAILALILRKLGKSEEADRANEEAYDRIERWLEINPDDARAHYHAGLRLLALRQPEKARKHIERAIAIDPHDPGVLYNVACFYSLANEPDKALDYLDRTIRDQHGVAIRDWITHDPDWDALRDLPRFREIVGRLP